MSLKSIFIICVLTSAILLLHTLAQILIPQGQQTRFTTFSRGRNFGDSGGGGWGALWLHTSWEAVAGTACCYWFPQMKDRKSEHSPLGYFKQSDVPEQGSLKTGCLLGRVAARCQHHQPLQLPVGEGQLVDGEHVYSLHPLRSEVWQPFYIATCF